MTIRIGNGCGFWGDNVDAPIFLAERGNLDYLTLEYLAELTMSILALQKQRDPKSGFASDFLDVLSRLAPVLKQQPKLKIITNAGGMNPLECAMQARKILSDADLNNRPVAAITGDDLMPKLDDLLASGHPLNHLDTGEPFASRRQSIVSANVYLGAKPIADALALGAHVVITGRVADASLTVAPAVHEFGWAWDDVHRLSAATVAGHLIECGAQVTGGLWCQWEKTDLTDVGYPIAEMDSDGTFTITKPSGTGGTVNIETVSEQLLYEVGDPAAYLTPDVVSDFTSVTLRAIAPDQVRVSGAKGMPATDTYKVSAAFRDGFISSGTLVIYGEDARNKARRAGEMLLYRLKRIGLEYAQTYIECLGAGDCVPGLSVVSPPEVVLRVSVRDPRKAAVERFTKEFAPLVTSGPPGVTGYTTGRPPVREIFAYWPALVAKNVLEPKVHLLR
jgi:hypothetical protein